MGDELSLANVVNISASQANLGVGAFNTSNLALLTAEQSSDTGGYLPTPGYKIYLDPTGVGDDFGTDSTTYDMAVAVFSQQPNVLAGGGYLVVSQFVPATQTIAVSGTSASGVFRLALQGLASADINWNATAAQIQTALAAAWTNTSGVGVSGSVAAGLTIKLGGFYGPAPLIVVTKNTLATGGSVPVTLTVATTIVGETYAQAITRLANQVQFFGVMPGVQVPRSDVLAAAAIVQALTKVGMDVSCLAADIASGGTLDLLRTGGFSKTRGLYYGATPETNGGQVVYLVPNVTSDSSTTYTVTVAGVTYSYTTAIPYDIVLGLVALINADSSAPVVASSDIEDDERLILTAKVAGVPFTWTASANMLHSVAILFPQFASAASGQTVTVNGVTFTAVNKSEQTPLTSAANVASSLNGTYLDIYEGVAPGTAVRFWFSTLGVGTAPAIPSGGRLVNVNLSNASLTDAQVMTEFFAVVQTTLAPSGDYAFFWSGSGPVTNTVTLIAPYPGNMTNADAATSGFTVGSVVPGSALGAAEFNVPKGGQYSDYIAALTLSGSIDASSNPALDVITTFVSSLLVDPYLRMASSVNGSTVSASDSEMRISLPFTPIGGLEVQPPIVCHDSQVMMAAYAGRAFSTDFSGSNTTSTMHLKTLVSIQPDPSMTQTLLTLAITAGADTYVSLQGDPAVFTSGENGGYFDQIYNLQWFISALQVAGFNYLAQSSTKVPQTESGMDGLKGAYRAVATQAVSNGYSAPGIWNSPNTFGNLVDFIYNISQVGFYVYSSPIAAQLQAARVARQAPLVQIALKEAGAIQKSNVIVYVNP